MLKRYFTLFFLLPISLFALSKITIIGDSISVGGGATNHYGFVEILEERFEKEKKEISIINRSFIGATSDTLYPIMGTALIKDKPDYIIIFLGVNDSAANIPQEKLLDNFSKALCICPSLCKVILGGVNADINNPGYNFILMQVYGELVENFNVIPLMLMGKEMHLLCDDGTHPNDKGHQIIADKIYNVFHELGVY